MDGKVVEVGSLQIQRGQQVMVWIRDLEKLGWGTIETPQPDRVALKAKSVTLTFIKGQGVALVNSLAVRLPIDTYMRDGQFMVPLSFVAKALGYQFDLAIKPVVTIGTAPPVTETSAAENSIRGRVTCNGAGVPGITVRAVDANFTVIGDTVAKTDAQGEYTITGLPDGEAMAYVYTGDNPSFFNRASKPVRLKGGQEFQVEPLALGRIITPVTPKPRAQNVSLSNDTVSFAWKSIDGAEKYRFVIREPRSGKSVFSTENKKPEAKVSANALRAGVNYEAEVTAMNAGGEFIGGTAGEGGTAWTFKTVR